MFVFCARGLGFDSQQWLQNFRVLKQTSQKSKLAFGLTMNFADQAAYDAYNNHPDHVNFVQGTWIPNVEEFQEIDHIDI